MQNNSAVGRDDLYVITQSQRSSKLADITKFYFQMTTLSVAAPYGLEVGAAKIIANIYDSAMPRQVNRYAAYRYLFSHKIIELEKCFYSQDIYVWVMFINFMTH